MVTEAGLKTFSAALLSVRSEIGLNLIVTWRFKEISSRSSFSGRSGGFSRFSRSKNQGYRSQRRSS